MENIIKGKYRVLVFVYIALILILLCSAILGTILYSFFDLNFYYLYIFASPLGVSLFFPLFLVSSFFLLKEGILWFKNKSDKDFSNDSKTPLYIGLIVVILFSGVACVSSSKILINIVKDIPYLNSPQEVTLYNGFMISSGSRRGFKKYHIYGHDDNNVSYKLIIGNRMEDYPNFSEIHIQYLPHTKITISQKIKE